MSKRFLKVFGAVALIGLFCFSFSANADVDMKTYAKNGFYIGAQANYLSLSGDDFNGQTFLYTSLETMFIPELDPSFGFGGLFGYREGNLGMELGIIASSPDGNVAGYACDTSLLLFDLNFKFWFIDDSELQPYILIGVDICQLTATDAAVENYYPYDFGDTKLTGASIALGAGLSYYVTPEISLNAGVNIHLMFFSSVSGVYEESYDLDETLSASLLNANFSVIFTL